MKTIYFVKLFSGDRCVGITRAQSSEHANLIAQEWSSKGDRHSARIEEKPSLKAERVEAIPPENYLTQTG